MKPKYSVHKNGLTVKELKRILSQWPEVINEDDDPAEIWIETGDGLSSVVTEIHPLNRADMLLVSGAFKLKNN